MASARDLLDFDPNGVLIAVDAHFAHASPFICATISTSPDFASVATAAMSPLASNLGVSAVPSSSSAAGAANSEVSAKSPSICALAFLELQIKERSAYIVDCQKDSINPL